MDRGPWQAIVHRVLKSRTQLKHFNTNTFDTSGIGFRTGGVR